MKLTFKIISVQILICIFFTIPFFVYAVATPETEKVEGERVRNYVYEYLKNAWADKCDYLSMVDNVRFYEYAKSQKDMYYGHCISSYTIQELGSSETRLGYFSIDVKNREYRLKTSVQADDDNAVRNFLKYCSIIVNNTVKLRVIVDEFDLINISSRESKPHNTTASNVNLETKTSVTDSHKTSAAMDNALKRVASLQQQRKLELGVEEGEEESSTLMSYYNQVQQQIIKEWNTLKVKFETGSVAKVVVRIDVNGQLIDINIKKSSDNTLMDKAIIRAVKKAIPFPVPPLSLRTDLAQDGFEFEFKS